MNDLAEDRLTHAIEPWFGEDARTVAVLLPLLTDRDVRAEFVAGLAERLGDATGLLTAINEAERSGRATLATTGEPRDG